MSSPAFVGKETEKLTEELRILERIVHDCEVERDRQAENAIEWAKKAAVIKIKLQALKY